MGKGCGSLCAVILAVAWIFMSATGTYLGVRSLAIPGEHAAHAEPREAHRGAASEHDREHSPGKPPPWTYGWFVHDAAGFFTFILCAITAFLAGYTFLLWRSTGNLVRGAEVTAERQLRAYVYFELETRNWPPDNPEGHDIYLKITNAGQTWARDVRIEQHRVEQSRTSQVDPFEAANWGSRGGVPGLIGPRQITKRRFDFLDFGSVRLLSDENTDAIHYYVARVRYRDTLNPQTVWETQMSMRLNTDVNMGISFTVMPTHNCADEDCLKE